MALALTARGLLPGRAGPGRDEEDGTDESVPRQPGPDDERDRLPHGLEAVQEIVDVRSRAGARARRADRLSALVLAFGYIACAVAWALRTTGATWTDLWVAVPLVVLYVLAYRTEFVSTSGSSVPTEPILVGMLLLLPLPLVPLTVLIALQFGGAGALKPGTWYDATIGQWLNGWHCIGPVVVLTAAGSPAPSLAHWRVYVVALVAQFAVDGLVAVVRTGALGVPVGRLVRPLGWTFATDGLLAPIGLAIVVAGGRSPGTILLLAAPIALIWLLARDRTEHLETAVSLSTAFTVATQEARLDPLTGVANRRSWEEAVAAAERQVAAGTVTSVTVLAADLDGLKHVNDTAGHLAGDAMIVGMAGALQSAIPQATLIARLGGDEFAALVLDGPGDGPADGPVGGPARGPGGGPGCVRPTDLVAAVRTAMSHHHAGDVALSASLGTASCPPEPSVAEAARAADARAVVDKIARRTGRRADERA